MYIQCAQTTNTKCCAQADFFATAWERKPCVYRAVDDRAAFLKGLCDYKALLHVAKAAEGTIAGCAQYTPLFNNNSNG